MVIHHDQIRGYHIFRPTAEQFSRFGNWGDQHLQSRVGVYIVY